MLKDTKIHAFFKRKIKESSDATQEQESISNYKPFEPSEDRPTKALRVEANVTFDINSLERDPGLRRQICEYVVDQRDEVRRAYIKAGPYQDLLSTYPKSNEKHSLAEVVKKAPLNASYTSPQVQKEILHVLGIKVKNAIREEIGDGKFCIIVDEARDESKKEQMSIVLRFVDKKGLVQERFFGLVHVKDTAALTLKEGIFSVLLHHNLDVQNIRGQGYDGASNMRGEWNGLQALILKECFYAYYVHCMAHRLQLALVAASKEVIPIHHFFTKLNCIVNIVGASCKRNDQLKAAHAENIAHLLVVNELESGKGLNQIGTLQRVGDTRWSSYLKSVSSLINMFSATCEVLLNIIEDGATSAQRGEADAAYEALTSFEFVFILHLMRKILEISNSLCQTLQLKSQDILNAMHLVSSTKSLIQNLRDEGWKELLLEVKYFYEKVNIPVLDLNTLYVARRRSARHQQDEILLEHHYKVDIYNAVIDSQLQELNNKFNDHTVELLILSSALDPKEIRRSFRVDDICKLVQKFYPQDFAEYDMLQKSKNFPLVYRVVTLVLTLPISTATTERSFSAMKIVKTRLHNKMEDEYLSDCLLVGTEEIVLEWN
ncbi:hypothetical protein K2173_012220 [Erythroxylum novogranatense]|uniref:Zinc finger MYM-type protein 1-like n=1 Tax=Erythroxylum novogranatense TaxID=1862640 RepID=A0AAV8T985_9ROSI|nr:hypothetical protein K2173_012220 [Erythroxylum novogranatense]